MDKASERPISLADLLPLQNINLHLAGKTQDEVLAALTDQISDIADNADAKRTLLHALIERERLHSTGIGDGVALPHARNALIGLVNHPVLAFGRHDQGVPYASIDGAPAKLFFLIIAPSVTLHLGILARLGRILRDPKLRKALLAADSGEAVVSLIRAAEAKS